MYAVVSTGGKQLKVEEGTEAVVERLDASVGDSVTLDVVFLADGDSITVGEAASSASVTAEVVEHFLGEKVVVFKFKRRKGYKRTKGHRQNLTRIRVTGIAAGGGAKKAVKKAATPPAPVVDAAVTAPVEETPATSATRAKAEAPATVVTEVEEAVKQCAAIKSNGERCANKAKEGSQYCGVHAKKYEG